MDFIGWRIGLVGCIALFSVEVVAAEAADSQRFAKARQLMLRADAMFQLKRDRDARALIKQVLSWQRSPKGELGYARYARFRLACFLHAQGKRGQARAELIRALKIEAGQEHVHRDHRVSRRHNFIVTHYPRLAGISVKRVQPHEAIPQALYLVGAEDRFVYGVGRRALYRLHRGRQTLLVVHQEQRSTEPPELTGLRGRFATHHNKKLVVLYDRDKTMQFIDFNPLSEHLQALPAFPERLQISTDGADALVFTRKGKYTAELYRLPLGASKPRRFKPEHSVRGELLAVSGDHAVWARYSGDRGWSFDPKQSPRFRDVVVRNLKTKAEQTIFAFPKVDHRNRLFATLSPSKGRLALAALDAASNHWTLVVHDLVAGRSTIKHHYKGALALPQHPLRFSFAEDYLLFFERQKNKLKLVRFGFRARGSTRVITVLKPRKQNNQILEMGVLKDNRTVWIQREGKLVLIGLEGKIKEVSLARFAKSSAPSWQQAYYFTDPDQFYFSVGSKTEKRFFVLPVRRLLSK